MEKQDSGYSSRRSSILSKQAKAPFARVIENEEDDGGYFSRRTSGLSKKVESFSDIEFTLVAEGTPSLGSQRESTSEVTPQSASMVKVSGDASGVAKPKPGGTVDGATDSFDPHPGHKWLPPNLDAAGESRKIVGGIPASGSASISTNNMTSASGCTITGTTQTFEPAKVEFALDGARNHRERKSGGRWSDLDGTIKDWSIVQGSPVSESKISIVDDMKISESRFTRMESNEFLDTATVESGFDGAEDCFDEHAGIRLVALGPGAAAEFQELMDGEMGKRGVKWYECGG